MRYVQATDAAFSHLTALALWDLRPQPPGEPIHATGSSSTRLRNGPLLVVHRSGHPIRQTWRYGVKVIGASQAIVDSWPLLPPDRVGVVLTAVSKRLAYPAQIRSALCARPQLKDAASLRLLLSQIDAGCRSQLEIWGLLWIFTGPGMPEFKRQHRVRAGGRVYVLDVYAEEERTAFELDGAAFHGSRAQREADLQRDAALAAVGIRVVRYAYSRLVSAPGEVRREVLAILAAARRF